MAETQTDYPRQQQFFEVCAAVIKRYHGWTISGDPGDMSKPCLIVGHHGFGTMTDPGVFALFASLGWLDRKLPVTTLMHDLNWKMKMGKAMEEVGGQPASRKTFSDAVARGHHVSVAPGGDYDTLIASIRERLWPMGDDTVFIPGHGPESTFGQERRTNPFVGGS